MTRLGVALQLRTIAKSITRTELPLKLTKPPIYKVNIPKFHYVENSHPVSSEGVWVRIPKSETMKKTKDDK